jgi:hypothetical protein
LINNLVVELLLIYSGRIPRKKINIMSKNTFSTLITLTTGLTLSTLINVDRAQAASFLIDEFHKESGDAQSIEVKQNRTGLGTSSNPFIYTTNYTNASSQSALDNSILGGYRDMRLSNASGFGTSTTRNATSEAIAGELVWDNDTNVVSELTVSWDGNDSPTNLNTTGLGGRDITNNLQLDGIFVEVISPDTTAQDFGNVALDVYDMSGTKYSLSQSIGEVITWGEREGLFFSFTEFTSTAGSATKNTFVNIGALQMRLYGDPIGTQYTDENGNIQTFNGGIDFNVSLLEVTETPDIPTTPEPSLSLFALAAFGTIGLKLKKSH